MRSFSKPLVGSKDYGQSELEADVSKTTKEGQWDLETFTFEDVKVLFPLAETAVIAYKVHQKGKIKGKPMDMMCTDSTTWVRDGDDWKCALHTETIMQDD